MKNIDKLWFIVPSLFILIAILPLPYGYYTLLRIVVSIAAGYIAFIAYSEGSTKAYLVIYGLMALLYNPILPVHLSREIWLPINLGTIGVLITTLFITKKNKSV
jgi:hypothetical protein